MTQDKKKRPMTTANFRQAIQGKIDDYHIWQMATMATIDTQRKNLWRADTVTGMMMRVKDQGVLVNLALTVDEYKVNWDLSEFENISIDTWIKGTIDSLEYMDSNLREVYHIIKNYTYADILEMGMHGGMDKIVEMIPYVKQDSASEDVARRLYWKELTYETIRPYGEKLRGYITDATKAFDEIVGEYREGEGKGTHDAALISMVRTIETVDKKEAERKSE